MKLNRTLSQTLTPEVIKLPGSTKSKITKDKNDERVPNLEITEVVFVQCNIAKNNHQQNSRVFLNICSL